MQRGQRQHPRILMQCIWFQIVAFVTNCGTRAIVATRKTAHGNDSQLVVRLPAALVGRVDRFAEHMRAELPGARFARAEAVRVLLTRALDQVSAKAK